MSNYYQDHKKAAIDLSNWNDSIERQSWPEFCRRMRLRYGFSPDKMKKMLEEDYPDVEV